MDHYKAGQLAEAIACWEPILRELGEAKGYRLAYDLGVVYAEAGDGPRAVERLQAFLVEVEARRGRGEAVPAIVRKEESDARARIAGLAATGRVVVPSSESPPAAPPPQPSATPSPAGSPPPSTASARAAPAATDAVLASTTPVSVRRETEHPFSPAFFAVSGALTVAAGVAAVPLEIHAWDLHDRYAAEAQRGAPIASAERQSFSDARTWAYAGVGAALGMAALTAGLAAWYFFGASQREVIVTPAGVSGRF